MKIISGKRKNKKSINKKIIRRTLIIIVIICAAVLAGYVFFSYQDIIARAEDSIRKYLDDQDFYVESREGAFFYVFECAVVDTGKPEYEYYFSDAEIKLIDYYISHKDSLEYGSIYNFTNSGNCVVYMPVEDFVSKDYLEYDSQYFEGRQGVILYCHLTYYLEDILNNALLSAVITAVVLLILFVVSRYTVKKLDEKDEQMKNFFANASHELKTPLMSIRGNVDGIREGYVDKDRGCDIIEKETGRMARLISDILEISRVDSGSLVPELANNDIREIIYDAVSSLMPEAEKNGISIEPALDEPIFRQCDESMLFSAFSNIISNDIRYAESFVHISSEAFEGRHKILFENDGDPISEEGLEHVFDRFYKGRKGQSGIGMALAQEYVRLHGSEIKVYVKGEHTVFEIVL